MTKHLPLVFLAVLLTIACNKSVHARLDVVQPSGQNGTVTKSQDPVTGEWTVTLAADSFIPPSQFCVNNPNHPACYRVT